MKKFSTSSRKERDKNIETLYSDDFIDIVKFDDWSIIKQPDYAVCIIYLIEEDQFILRHEYIPTFNFVDKQEYHLTVLSGTIEDGETADQTIIREIEEEAGIVLSADFKIEFMKPLFISKGQTSKYYPCIITLTEKDYHEVIAKTDGSKAEKLSKSIKLDKKYINSVNTSDMITEFMIEKFKRYLNI